MKRYRTDRRPWRYQPLLYEFIVGGFLVYLAGCVVWKAGAWVWGLVQ